MGGVNMNQPTLSPQHQEILDTLIKMYQDKTLIGAFSDIPIEVYHHPQCPAVSSSMLKTTLRRSFSHWKTGHNIDSEGLSFGNLFHQFVSEPHKIRENKESTGKKANYADIFVANKMFDKMMRQPIVRSMMRGASHEVSYFSLDKETGLLKKCRLDGYNNGIVFDFKSTRDASQNSFIQDCRKFDYRLSAAYYLEIVSEVTGQIHDNFVWIASEKEDPHECALYNLHRKSIEAASQDIREALNKIKLAIDTSENGWDGYSRNVTEIMI